MQLNRRRFLVGSAGTIAFGGASLQLRAAQTDGRFVLVFLRGAMDGLDVVVPYGDPNLRAWRPNLVLPDPGQSQQVGQARGLADLGGFWGLHPSLRAMHALYQANDLLPIQAVAGSNRSRSHFEAQDMMEIGAETRMTSGWLNRIAAQLPPSPNCDVAFSMSTMAPLILQGPTPTTAWDPFHARPKVSGHFYDDLVAMHADDPLTGAGMTDGLKVRRYLDKVLANTSYDGLSNGFPRLARAAAHMLAAPDGPRLAELDLDGWDTHTNQRPRLFESLRRLDEGIAVMRAGLAEVWSKTVILVLTEFGRTVRVNGAAGTDHGTGTAAFLAGGAVQGGKVLADWPGLAETKLFENRDLQPTLDIRAIAKGVLGPLLHVAPQALAQVFPDSDHVTPQAGLLKF